MPGFWDDFDRRAGGGYNPDGTEGQPTGSQAPAAPADPRFGGDRGQPHRYQPIIDAYQQYLGRYPSDAELNEQTNYGRETNFTGIINGIRTSEEAKTYAAQPAAPTSGGTAGAGRLEGFGGKRADGSAKLGSDHANKSPKYAFASVMQNYPNTEEGRQAGFKELQTKFPQFFGNWELEGDDSIKWNGQGQLHEAFQGHDNFDTWRNASGEDGGPGGWQWNTNREDLLPPEQRGQTGGPGMSLASMSGGRGGYGGGFDGVHSRSGSSSSFAGYDGFEAYTPPEPFQAPTEADMQQDPGYQFRVNQGAKAMTNSASAKGLLRSGGTLKDFLGYGQDMASQEYGNVYGRRASEYDRQAGMGFQANQANNAGRLGFRTGDQNFALGQGNLGLGYHRAGNDYSLGMANVGLGYHQANNAYSLGQGQLGLGWANYGMNDREQRFSQGYRLSDLGFRAASQQGQYGSYYGQGAAESYYGQGNANAAGRVGSANAWANAWSNTGRDAMTAADRYYRGPGR